LHEYNETFCKIQAPRELELELQDRFSFYIPNHKHNPKVRRGEWDGIIKLLNRSKKTIYKGLEEQIKKYCVENGYEVESNLNTKGFPINDQELSEFLDEISTSEFERRPYQLEAIKTGIQNKRATFLSATSSGKSFIIYALTRFWDKPTLIIVPTIGLVAQMKSDFKDYCGDKWDVEANVSTIKEGESKENLKNVTISTWQSIYKLIETDPEWFSQFELIHGDECHGAKAKALKGILEHCTHVENRYGFTGTLDGEEVNELVVEGLFGKIVKVIKAHELIDLGYASPINIKCINFQYNKASKTPKRKYPDEISFINKHQGRLEFIVKLAAALPGNTLILFRKVEEHGKVLVEMAEKMKRPGSKVHFIFGKISVDDREIIRAAMEQRDVPQNLYASEGTSAVGTNIKNIDNIIFASPSKSRIRVLQSIGRGLRKSKTKNVLNLFDLSDDLRKKTKNNYTYDHFMERLKMYMVEQFPYTIKEVRLEN
jgi:superfamily II DNA or RNA helicase